MLKTLVKIRMSAIVNSMFRQSMRRDGKKGKGMKVLLAVAFVYLGLCLLFLIGMMCYMVAGALASAGLGWLYHAVIGLMAVMLCFMGSVFLAQSQIFSARDNELLLSMPVPPRTIVASRLLSFLLLNYLYTAIVMVPAAVVYAAVAAPGISFYIGYIVGFLLLPMLSMTITCAIGYVITLLTARLRHKNLVTGIAMILFFLGFMFLYMNLTNYAMALIQNGAAIATAFKRALPPFYSFGLAAEGSPLHLLLAALWCVVPFLIVYALLSRSFQRLATTNRGAAKIKYVAREMHVKSPRAALFRKELGRVFGLPLYLFNCALGGVLALILGIVLLVKGPDLIQSFAALYGMGGAVLLIVIPILVQVFMALLGLCLNLVFPRLDWISQAAVIKQSGSVMATVFAGMGLIALPALLYGFWLSHVMTFEMFGLLVSVLLALGCAALTLYLSRGGRRRFEAL